MRLSRCAEVPGLPENALLEGRDLRLRYGVTLALNGVSVAVQAGRSLAITGASGSGKTSLLYCLAGLVAPSEGNVYFDGNRFGDLREEQRVRLRRTAFGFIFQFAELVPELTIRENVGLPLELNRVARHDRARRVEDLLSRLGIAEIADRRSAQVSGGQAQRAAVARALAHRPRVVFADEPTGSVDTENGETVLRMLFGTARDEGTAIVLVTHDATVAEMADYRIQMRDGCAIQRDS